jgi:GT2 family glycosyltransferase
MTPDDVWIVVPVGKREKYLPNILKSLKDFHGRIVFVNNKEGYSQYPGVHHIEDFGDINIYRWWNKGIDFAQSRGAKYVAILNDDLEFDHTFIPSLFSFLIKNKLAIADTDRSSNGGGAAWMMDLSYNLRLDERFRWWYGDTELFDRAKKMHKFNKFVPGYFKHFHPNGYLDVDDTLQTMSRQDRDLYFKLKDSNVS